MSKLIKSYFKDFNRDNYISPISQWLEMLKNDELVEEESNYKNFYGIILKDLLGYELNDYGTQVVIEKGRKADVVLKKNEEYYAIIELKGTKTENLNKRYDRPMSAVEQVINYTSVKEESKWAIVSNYDEFRLFNPNSSEKYISFNFEDLTDEEHLKKFLLVFSKLTLIENNVLEKLLEKSKILEKDLEDEFYVLFGVTRSMLIKEFEISFKDMSRDKTIGLAQLILNRYIFICFAEDLELIPQTTKNIILGPVKSNLLFKNNIWNNLNSLFQMMDMGNKVAKIHSFNGGLFKEDISKFKISDCKDSSFFSDCFEDWKFVEDYADINKELGENKDVINPIYKNLLLISAYNFKSDVSVNILGHILENSIGDIEILKNEKEFKRKKEGVYYTPEYITDYICKNTIIPYLSLSGNSNNTHDLIEEYKEINDLDSLDFKLKNIKIIDPACGSGAFLNKAVDVLYEIHKELYDSKYDDGSLDKYVFDSLKERRQIIRNNIFGVDLNDESVEITKLSLFLKLATNSEMKDGFKLPNLDKNIKCGNSLIDDKEIVGQKAFKWKVQFKEIFDDGGFDVVIGNPPYIKADLQDDFYQKQREWLWNSKDYETLYERWDFYIAFIEKGLKILNKKGILSYIISNTYITGKFSKKSKEFIFSNFSFRQLDFFKNMMVFEDASVESFILNVENSNEVKKCKRILHDGSFNKEIVLKDNEDIFQIEDTINFDSKFENTSLLGDICYINYGMAVNADEKKAKGEFQKKDLISDTKNSINCKAYVEGKYLKPYEIQNIKYLEWGTDRVPNKIRRPTFKELYEYPKLIRGTTTGAIYDEKQLLCNHSCSVLVQYFYLKDVDNRSISNSIKKWTDKSREELEVTSGKFDINYILAILNSKFAYNYLNSIRKHRILNYFYPDDLKKLPIKSISLEEQKIFSNLAIDLSENYKNLYNEINSFQKWLKRTFEIEGLSKKLEKYYELEFEEFLNELKKKKVDITKRKTQDLLEKEFNESLEIIDPLQREIKETDNKINQLVYELYDLTDDEIETIEGALK